MTKFKLFALAFAAFGLSATAFAAPITGDISLSNNGDYDVLGCSATPIADECVTGYDFADVDGVRVASSSGDLAAIDGAVGNIADFDFDPTFTAVEPLWTIGDFSFDLLSVSAPQYFSFNNTSVVAQAGLGILRGVGFDDTEYNWVMSSTNPGSGTFSWSATQTRVPEPGTLALLGLGLLGFGLGRRKAA